jgi:hypothetical protein
MVLPALAPSFQNPGSALCASFDAMIRSIEATSKTPPYVENLLSQRCEGVRELFDHSILL